MNLSLETRQVADVAVIRCRGRIIEGDEGTRLRETLDAVIADAPFVVLNLSSVDFIDSSGLGLLVRYLHKTEAARGGIKLCAVPPRILQSLEVTHLAKLFEMHESEEQAVTGFYRGGHSNAALYQFSPDILCVASSPDVLAYVRELLGQAGYSVVSATNLPDALTLLKATRPRLLIMGGELREAPRTPAAEKFHQLAATLAVIDLPADFSSHEAAEAGRQLLDQVRTLVSPS